MKIIEAKEALISACESLVAEATEKGLVADYRCFAANADLEEVDDSSSKVRLIAAEMTLGAEGTEKEMLLECALSISDGDVAEDEILREVGAMRENLREFYQTIDEMGGVTEALDKIAADSEEPAPEVKVYDNRKFYIGASAVALLAIIIVIVARFL